MCQSHILNVPVPSVMLVSSGGPTRPALPLDRSHLSSGEAELCFEGSGASDPLRPGLGETETRFEGSGASDPLRPGSGEAELLRRR